MERERSLSLDPEEAAASGVAALRCWRRNVETVREAEWSGRTKRMMISLRKPRTQIEQSEKPSSAMGDSASASPSTLSQPAATPPPQLDEAPAAAAEQPANDNFASDAVFEELAQELESDPSSSLLNELQDLCSFETQNNVSANFAQSTSYVNDDELFLSLERGLIPGADGGVGEEKESLLAELSAMGHDEPLTLTFGDFPIEGGKAAKGKGKSPSKAGAGSKPAAKPKKAKLDGAEGSPPAKKGKAAKAAAEQPPTNLLGMQQGLVPLNLSRSSNAPAPSAQLGGASSSLPPQGAIGQGMLSQATFQQGAIGQQGPLGQGAIGQCALGQGMLSQGAFQQGALGQGPIVQGALGQGALGQGAIGQSALGQGMLSQGAFQQGAISQGPISQSTITMGAAKPLTNCMPFISQNPNGQLPSAKSAAKWLPGAVVMPAPAPTKQSLGGRPSAGASMGRSFSWQPIKFPTYK